MGINLGHNSKPPPLATPKVGGEKKSDPSKSREVDAKSRETHAL